MQWAGLLKSWVATFNDPTFLIQLLFYETPAIPHIVLPLFLTHKNSLPILLP
jgi:hypothetical protein